MPRLLLFLICVLAMSAGDSGAAPRKARQVVYVGVHPLSGSTICNVEGAHVHMSTPEHADVLYRVHDGRYYFVGDPMPFGYDGSKYPYYGHHRIVLDDDVGDDSFCYIDGPHYHLVEPQETTFVLRGGAYWYTGSWSPRYKRDAPRLAKVNLVYEPLLYSRPIVTIGPPPTYRPPVLEVVVKTPAPRVVVTAPTVHVYAPWIVVETDYHYDLYYPRHRRHRHHKHDD